MPIEVIQMVHMRDMFLKLLSPGDGVTLKILSEKFDDYAKHSVNSSSVRKLYTDSMNYEDFIAGAAVMFGTLLYRMAKPANPEDLVYLSDITALTDFLINLLGLATPENMEYANSFLESVFDSAENSMDRVLYATSVIKTLISSEKEEKWKSIIASIVFFGMLAGSCTFPPPSVDGEPVEEVAQGDPQKYEPVPE